MGLFDYENYIKEEALTPEEIEEIKKAMLASHMRMYVSKDLAETLKRMESPIANDLLTLSRRNVKFDISFMDIVPDQPGMVTYIQTGKVKKMEDAGLDIKKGRSDYNSEIWTTAQRVQPTRINKVINKIFRGKYNAAELEKFGNEYKAKAEDKNDKMFVVYGNDIKKYYHQDWIAIPKGPLSTSCMRHPDRQKFFRIYQDNTPESGAWSHIGMLILLDDNGKLLGRAIVWFNSVKPDPERVFMDRIYTCNDHDINTFQDYAKKHGWLYKQQQTYNNATYIDPRDNSKHTLTISYRLLPKKYDYYPFLDTLQYYTPETGRIASTPNKNKKYKSIRIQEQHGGHQNI